MRGRGGEHGEVSPEEQARARAGDQGATAAAEEGMPAGARPDQADTAPPGEPTVERLSRGGDGERGKAPDTDAAKWNDTWAGEVSPEEQARARALLGLALAGGQGAAEAVEEWSRAGSGPARGAGADRGRRRGFGNRRPMSRRDDGGAADGSDGFDEPDRSWGRGRRRGAAGRVGSDDPTGWDHPGDEYDPDGEADRRYRGDGTRHPAGVDSRDEPDRFGDGGRPRGEGTGSGAMDAAGLDGPYDPGGHAEADRPRGRWSSGGRRRGGGSDRGESRRSGPAQIDPEADPEAAARAICLRQLTGQPRTRAQLADALQRRGVPDDVAEHVLGRFTEVKLIDDAAFAAAWVDTRHVGRGLARRALARELRQRGVDPDLVHEAVERLDPEQELETARALVARKLPSTRRLDRQVRMRRLAAMLARKGYSEGLALRVVREALDADEDPPE